MQTKQTVRALPIAIPATIPIERTLVVVLLMGSEVVLTSAVAVVSVTAVSVHMYT